jgi:cell division protein FtsI/penicillin-binding protein 2
MRRPLVIFVTLLVAAGIIVIGATIRSHLQSRALPTREVDTFLDAWSRGAPPDMATLLDAVPPDLDPVATGLVKAVPRSSAVYTRTALTGSSDNAIATYHARVTLAGLGLVEWNNTLAVVHGHDGWRIRWSPSSMYPGLQPGQHLTAKQVWPARAAIVDAHGTVLASGGGGGVQVGLEPDHITSPADIEMIKTRMKALLGVEPATIDATLQAPGVRLSDFLPVKTIPRDSQYQRIRDALAPIPGIFFREVNPTVAVDQALESSIVPELQRTFQKQLAGLPRTDVVIVDAQGTPARVVKRFPGRAAQPVQLTIDLATQRAAEEALANETNNAALVALDTTTGAIRAVVSKPDGGFNRALAGTYPPGSTFKVVTSAALIGAGDNGSTPAPCPPTTTVDGRSFKNFEGEASTSLDLATAFAKSCNNAFIGLATKLPQGALDLAATSFGFNTKWSLGVDAKGGSYPKPVDQAELAASAIGQARVLASPVQMASVAATVAAGRWHAPTLVSQPAPPAGPTVAPLSPVVTSTLQSFMASVPLAGGTAAGAGLPPGTFGKTGTAEFGNGNPPPTHAWFIGYRNNLAFAVIVENGGVGGEVAAPLAAKFLNALPH